MNEKKQQQSQSTKKAAVVVSAKIIVKGRAIEDEEMPVQGKLSFLSPPPLTTGSHWLRMIAYWAVGATGRCRASTSSHENERLCSEGHWTLKITLSDCVLSLTKISANSTEINQITSGDFDTFCASGMFANDTSQQ